MECKIKTHSLAPKRKRVVGNFEMGLRQTQKFELNEINLHKIKKMMINTN
jgi:hypothetical protein